MKPRIEKKLSKKLAVIMAGYCGAVWIDNEVDLHRLHFKPRDQLTPKQERENREQCVRVNHIPSVGGGLDYWGEGEDWYTVFASVRDLLFWDKEDWTIDEFEEPVGRKPHPWRNIRQTGLFLLRAARMYVIEQNAEKAKKNIRMLSA